MIDVSVIIPCYNEESTIAEVLIASARELSSSGLSFELIVVDNGSIDSSVVLAKGCNASVIYSDAKTISGVRNKGVVSSVGQVIVFLDADIVVQACWGDAFEVVYSRMLDDGNFIAGSHPCVPSNIGPVLISWYKSISEDFRNTHLGTGHLVVSRDTFDRIGGFDEDLITGEDYDFCRRAKRVGVDIVAIPQMVVFHLGYPDNLIEFAKREVWHGLGDCSSFVRLMSSKISIVGGIFLFLNVASISVIYFSTTLSSICVLSVIFIVAGVNFFKFGFGDLCAFLFRSIVAYVYLMSRGLSIPVSMFMKIKQIKNLLVNP